MILEQALLREEKTFESGFTLPEGAAIWISDRDDEGNVLAHFYGTPKKGWSANVFVLGPDEYTTLIRAKTQEKTTMEVH